MTEEYLKEVVLSVVGVAKRNGVPLSVALKLDGFRFFCIHDRP
jgi:hypothetical protein